jgi:hypothetical protein
MIFFLTNSQRVFECHGRSASKPASRQPCATHPTTTTCLIELRQLCLQRADFGARVGADRLGLLALRLGQGGIGGRGLRKLAVEARQQRRAGRDFFELSEARGKARRGQMVAGERWAMQVKIQVGLGWVGEIRCVAQIQKRAKTILWLSPRTFLLFFVWGVRFEMILKKRKLAVFASAL